MMSKRTYNDQTINEYLLGSLPEAESERLDELSFTDDEFAEALRAAEKDLVDAYVQGELSGAALERFKSHYLSTPRRRGNVFESESDQQFRRFWRPAPAHGTADSDQRHCRHSSGSPAPRLSSYRVYAGFRVQDPDGVDMDALQGLMEEIQGLSTPEFEKAGDAINKHAKDECDVDLQA